MRSKKTYLIINILSHVMFISYCFVFGFGYLYTLLIGFVAYNLAAEVYMHRSLSHNHFKFSDGVQKFLNTLYSMCNFGSLLISVSAHHNHHKFMDHPGDPHDFRRIGMFRMIIKDWDNYSPDKNVIKKLIVNKNLKSQHYNHVFPSLVSAMIFPFIPVASFWLLNLLFVVAHFGKYPSSDINIPILYPLMLGSEMHRDHHSKPYKKKMHQFDIMYYSGKILSMVK